MVSRQIGSPLAFFVADSITLLIFLAAKKKLEKLETDHDLGSLVIDPYHNRGLSPFFPFFAASTGCRPCLLRQVRLSSYFRIRRLHSFRHHQRCREL